MPAAAWAFLLIAVCATLQASPPVVAGKRRAVLIGIDDYSATALPRPKGVGVPDRVWPPLHGAVRDVEAMREVLCARYGFRSADIVILSNQRATRAAILAALERHLLAAAAQGDVLLFYFSGHGSQVPNPRSTELDRLDESIVPADSRLGALDIRDKELSARFNAILDRGARLTVILDSCHSGSGARGLASGAAVRGIAADSRPVADGRVLPGLEDRGALILSASQDFERAYETVDDRGQPRGAFSWAWLRALRDAQPGEAAGDTFSRAQAMMRADTPYQDPVIGGNSRALLTPFLGGNDVRRGAQRSVVAVERVQPDGSVLLQGGWAHGLSVGAVLRPVDSASAGARIEVTAMLGLGRCQGRIANGGAQAAHALRSGALLEVVSWAASPGRQLRVWVPRVTNLEPALTVARRIRQRVASKNVRWVTEPTEVSPTYVLRWRDNGWELVGPGSAISPLGRDVDADAVVASLAAHSSLFVQLPAQTALVEAIGIGQGTPHDGVERIEQPENADYFLVGRMAEGSVEYAWVRPSATAADETRSPLPARTNWESMAEPGDAALLLQRAVLRLRKVQAWHLLQSPPESASPYRLTFRQASGAPLTGNRLTGGQTYELTLRAEPSSLYVGLKRRYFYVFGIDSWGASVLLFPLAGSVENHFPLSIRDFPPREIPLASFTETEPFGLDTYILLTSDEGLPQPSVVEWSGVRTRGPKGSTPLEELLSLTGGSSRASMPIPIPAVWSIQRVMMESMAPQRSRQ